jgi:putative peptidoglycan lipid II flippase
LTERLARSAGLIGLATFASRILGLVRDQAQAHFFGTGHDADAFGVATRIPSLLRDLFAEGAMSAAFVPTFTRRLTRDGKEAAWRLGSQLLNALFIVVGSIVVLGIVFAEPLARFLAHKYEAIPGKLEKTILLTQVNMPFLLLIALAAACMGMLNALRRFFVPALSPAMFNVAFIVCLVGGVPFFRSRGIDPVMAMSLGMIAGGVVQIASQWPSLRREGYRHAWVLNPRDPALHEVLFLMGPGAIGVAAAQINMTVNTMLATNETSAVSALNYAFRLMYLPIGIFGVSAATAAIPDLARHAESGAFDEMRKTASWALRLMLMLSVPSTIGLMVLGPSIVEMVFQRGQFDANSTSMTAQALLFYAPGIIGYSVVKIASPSFYALRDAKTPVIVSVVTILANVALNYWLARTMGMGFRGLALGTAIAANVNAGLLLYLLSRRTGGIDGPRVLWALVKIAIASGVMALTAYGMDTWLRDALPARLFGTIEVPRILRVGLSIGTGVATLAASAWILKIDEFTQALRRIMARVRPS